ncbi:MAG: TetR/AcrR family transcriptional regulator C-terminal domain-containing protein [Tissierellia bacterium]|nr:TetR/AcrR family transcriptional regulator C-terminal domain-containing protein [Tissierellia bacterium]
MIICNNTKEIIVNSLKELMKTKPFKKITVYNIVSNCSTTRQTFYNHFKDKYDVVNFIYSKHADKCYLHLGNNYTWYDTCLEVLNVMREDKDFYINAVNFDGQNSLLQIIFSHGYKNCMDIIKKKNNTNTVDENLKFKLKFFIYGIIKSGEEWAKNGMIVSPEQIAKNIMDCMPEELYEYLCEIKTPHNTNC